MPISKLNSNGQFDIAFIKKVLLIDTSDISGINSINFKNLWKSSIPKRCKFMNALTLLIIFKKGFHAGISTQVGALCAKDTQNI